MFDLLNVVAKTNKDNSSYLNAFRFKDSKVYATNNLTTICMDRLPFDDLDCMVDAAMFMRNYNASTSPTFEQIDNDLVISDSKMTINLATIEVGYFPEHEYSEPSGLSYEISDKFIDAVRLLSPFVKQENARIIIVDGFAYITDKETLVKTPIGLKITEPILLSRSFVDLLAAIKQQPIEAKITDTTFSIIFEDLWIRTARFSNIGNVENITKHLADFDSLEFTPLASDVRANILHICESADKDDKVFTDADGVHLKHAKQNIKVAIALPEKKFKPNALKPVLKQAVSFHWDRPGMLIFKSDTIQGLITEVGSN